MIIPEYIEIEGKNEQEVFDTLDKLGISKEKVVTLDVLSIYKKYGYDAIHDLNFEMEEKE